MDSLTTQSSVSSSSSFKLTYDVYLSFSGVDTRHTFTDHLYSSLTRKGIVTFRDAGLERGIGLSTEVPEAIRESRASIVILSGNYASSTWCLDELVHILQCKKSKNQIVIPVFYMVDPTDVRDQRGAFGNAFVNHESRFEEQKVSTWKEALKEVANLNGYRFGYGALESELESEIIDLIIEDISSKVLNRTYLDEEKLLVGIYSRMQEIDELLGVGVADVRMLGIWGIGGIGKTTVATAVYNSIAHKFEGSCFLAGIGENSRDTGGLVALQRTLLSEILGVGKLNVVNADQGIDMIKRSLRHKKVLLILDDVDQLDQLKTLAGANDWFGAGSRIIITTRDKNLPTDHQVDFMYEVPELVPEEAFELFRWTAFSGRGSFPDDYMRLAHDAVEYAKGIPLALTVMGKLICGKSINEWEAVLESYKRCPPLDTKNALENALLEIDEAAVEMNDETGQQDVNEDANQDSTKNTVFSAEWMFLIVSFILELLSAACDQLSTPRKPWYSIIAVAFAVSGLLSCSFEIIFKGRKEKVRFGWCGWVCWFYFPSTGTLFGTTFIEMCGLICAMSQCISSILQCICVLKNRDNPFKVNLLPSIFIGCLIVSKLTRKCKRSIITDKTRQLKTIASD